ncbi:helix-turn-helix domain-containing protein [Streptomyces sp. NBC_00988]|uniref:helix-turn-helix domain-containing protein n=1 Tax=Streptomyces sp. NBC_00988 TaxID=2903704 RepID=UPI00386FF79A
MTRAARGCATRASTPCRPRPHPGTAYAASLTAWLGAVGSVGETAQRLTIQPDALRYRLPRARELFSLAPPGRPAVTLASTPPWTTAVGASHRSR